MYNTCLRHANFGHGPKDVFLLFKFTSLEFGRGPKIRKSKMVWKNVYVFKGVSDFLVVTRLKKWFPGGYCTYVRRRSHGHRASSMAIEMTQISYGNRLSTYVRRFVYCNSSSMQRNDKRAMTTMTFCAPKAALLATPSCTFSACRKDPMGPKGWLCALPVHSDKHGCLFVSSHWPVCLLSIQSRCTLQRSDSYPATTAVGRLSPRWDFLITEISASFRE